MDTTTAGRPGTGRVDGTRFDADWWRMRTPLIVIAGLAIAGFSLVLASTNEIGHAAAWGLAATAVLLGARHAFDADHVAVIDNVTRRLATADQSRLRGGAVGFWFALGHSSVVIITAALVTAGAAAARSLVVSEDSDLRAALGMWGLLFATCVVGVFGIVNLVAFIRLLRDRRTEGAPATAPNGDSGAGAAPRGPLTTVFSRLIGTVDRPARMYPIGLLFGLGFDTAATIGLMIAAGATAASTSPLLALSLPLLFAAGMAACDTGDSVMMARLYRWAAGDGGRFRRYNLIVTGLSVLIAAIVVIAGVAEAGAETATFTLPAPDTEYAGFVATGLFVVIAVAALLTARRRAAGNDRKDEGQDPGAEVAEGSRGE